MKKCTCNAYQLENFGCKCGASESNTPEKVAYKHFEAHETFMIQLCKVLMLDYENVTEEDILKSVKGLKQFYDWNGPPKASDLFDEREE